MAARRSAGGNALMPSRRRPDREPMPTFSIFPDQVHIGDRLTDADTGDDPAGDLDVVERAGPLAEVGDYSFSFSIFPCTVTRNPVPFLAFFASLTISGHHFTSLAACCQMGRSAKLLRKKMVRPESNQAARS